MTDREMLGYDEPAAEVKDEAEDERAKLFGHTLNEDGSLRCVSPSQIKTHKLCERKHYYDKVEHRPHKPKGKGAALGTECHKEMEDYLNTGVDIRGPLARHGHEMIAPYIHRAPFNGGDMLVEAPLLDPQLMTNGGVRISGFSDVTLPPIGTVGGPLVLDHKFRKKLDLYAETSEQLKAGDPQAVIYSTWALMKWPAAPDVGFQHNNHQTEGARKNLPVAISDDRATVFAKFAKLGKYIDEKMAASVLKATALEVEAAGDTNPDACRAFGGCDYLDFCPSAPHNRYMAALSGHGEFTEMQFISSKKIEPSLTQGRDLMGLLDEMEAAKNNTPAVAPKTVPTALPPVEAGTCKVGGVYMCPGSNVGKFEGVLGDRAIFKDKAGGLLQCAPSDYVKDLNGDPVSVALFAPKTHKLTVVDKSTTPDTTPAITQAAGIVPPDAPADTNPPKTTAQTPAVLNTVGNSSQGSEVTKGAESPSAAEEKKPKAAKKAKATGTGLIILVNNACPAAEDLQPYVQGLADAIATKNGLEDIRLAGNDNPCGFGKWKAMLTLAAKSVPPPAGLYVVRTGDLADPVIEGLTTVGIVSFGGAR